MDIFYSLCLASVVSARDKRKDQALVSTEILKVLQRLKIMQGKIGF